MTTSKTKLPQLQIKGNEPDPISPRTGRPSQLHLGDFVGIVNGCSYGRVFMIRKDFNQHGDLYYIRHYDGDTGYPKICPDTRCANSDMDPNHHVGQPPGADPATLPRAQAWPPVSRGDSCPICCTTGDRARFSRYSTRDVDCLRQEGLINGT